MRGRGFIRGFSWRFRRVRLSMAALAEGVLFNSTQDTVVRFLPPFLHGREARGQGDPRAEEIAGRKKRASELPAQASAGEVRFAMRADGITKKRGAQRLPKVKRQRRCFT